VITVIIRDTSIDYIARMTTYGLLTARYRKQPRRPTCPDLPRS
jgi:hypothetical protein